MSLDFEVIVGTYEQFLLGYKIHDVDSNYDFEKSFATHSHLASIRAVASNKHYLASAGADDSVFLYDMRYRIESGRLMHHSGTINCLDFTPDASHIITASSDGSIGIVRCGNWLLEKHWKSPHKGCSVNALAIHPTGKLAISAGGDGVLRTWNLVKGRQAYATNLVPRLSSEGKNVAILRWSPSGDKYLLVSQSRLDVYSVETAGLCSEMSLDSKITCVEFIKNDLLAIGHENGKIRLCDIGSSSSILEIAAHDARVKCIANRNNYLVSASSTGEIKLWRYAKKKLTMLSRTSSGARITCITLTQPCPDLTVKREAPGDEEKMEKPRENFFRMRQEVIIEDEEEKNTTAHTKNRRPTKKKTGIKKLTKRPLASEEIEDTSNKKRKRKEIVAIPESVNNESPKRKKSLPVEKPDDGRIKKKKKETARKMNADVVPSKEIDGNVSSVKSKGKKIKQKITMIEKPSKPVSKKGKQQNAKSGALTGFPVKTKKTKLKR